jgi:hypothetical protein
MLNARRLGLAGGIIWSISMFICTVLAIYTGYTKEFLNLMGSIYLGYSISWPGAFIGLVYGFIDAFVGFYLLAWLYNKLEV